MRRITFITFLAVLLAMPVLLGCGLKFTQSAEDIQKLEDAKNLFTSQMENDMHPIIWTYLDEVLHDPESFKLQRFEYKRGDYVLRMPYEAKKHLFGNETMTQYGEVIVFAYQINMRYRVRVPAGGIMLKTMTFYLLKDKNIILPNRVLVSLLI